MKNQRSSGIIPPKSGDQLIDMYYLEARSHLLETAAILDRIERAKDNDKIIEDSRINKLFDICNMLTETRVNRAEKLLKMLSVS